MLEQKIISHGPLSRQDNFNPKFLRNNIQMNQIKEEEEDVTSENLETHGWGDQDNENKTEMAKGNETSSMRTNSDVPIARFGINDSFAPGQSIVSDRDDFKPLQDIIENDEEQEDRTTTFMFKQESDGDLGDMNRTKTLAQFGKRES